MTMRTAGPASGEAGSGISGKPSDRFAEPGGLRVPHGCRPFCEQQLFGSSIT